MSSFLWYFITGPQALGVVLCLVLYWSLGLAVGAIFRTTALESMAVGLLLLASVANSVLFAFRGLGLDPSWFGTITILLTLAVAYCLRRSLFQNQGLRWNRPFSWGPGLAFAVCAVLIWLTQMLTPDPMAGMTAHQPWYALYLDASFSRDHFLTEADLASHPGIMSSLLLNSDLLGLSALGRWAQVGSGHQAFLAAAIAGAGAAMAILCRGLDRNPLVLWGFVAFFVVYFKTDRDFSLWVGNNWGDVLMYLGGAVCLHYLTDDRQPRHQALLAAGLAACMLVQSRSYGMFYGAVICAVCMVLHIRDSGISAAWRSWMLLFVLGTVGASRELYLLLGQSSPYYDAGQWFGGSVSITDMLRHALSLGRSKLGRVGDAINVAYWAAAAILGLIWWRRRNSADQTRLGLTAAAPLIIMAGPVALTLMTGYVSTTKLYAIKLFLLPWYPWRVAAALLPPPSRRVKVAALGLAALGGVSAMALTKEKLANHPLIAQGLAAWLPAALESYRQNNIDILMDRELRRQPAALQDLVRDNRILLLHDEPGMGLRYFFGGDLFKDLDFWSQESFDAMQAGGSLEQVIDRLGNPVIYLPLGPHSFHYGHHFTSEVWKDYAPRFSQLEGQPWIACTLKAGPARLFIPRKALDGLTANCTP